MNDGFGFLTCLDNVRGRDNCGAILAVWKGLMMFKLDIAVGMLLLFVLGTVAVVQPPKVIHAYNQFLMLCYAYPSVVHWVFFGFVMVALQVVYAWCSDIYDLWKGEIL